MTTTVLDLSKFPSVELLKAVPERKSLTATETIAASCRMRGGSEAGERHWQRHGGVAEHQARCDSFQV